MSTVTWILAAMTALMTAEITTVLIEVMTAVMTVMMALLPTVLLMLMMLVINSKYSLWACSMVNPPRMTSPHDDIKHNPVRNLILKFFPCCQGQAQTRHHQMGPAPRAQRSLLERAASRATCCQNEGVKLTAQGNGAAHERRPVRPGEEVSSSSCLVASLAARRAYV